MIRSFGRSMLLSVLTLAVGVAGLAIQANVAFAAPTTCSGVVFHDYDADGQRLEDYSHVSADYATWEDDGVPGITVEITDINGVVSTATTDANGEWAINLDTDNFPIRIDFSGLPTGWSSHPIGPDSGPLTQFVDDPATCGVGAVGNAGIGGPGSFCENQPDLATTCFLFGDVAGHDDMAAIVTLPDGAIDNGSTAGTGFQVDPYTVEATLGEVGSIYGIATTSDGSIYGASFVKRHAQIGPSGNPTTLYWIDPTGNVSEFYTTDPAAVDPHSAYTDAGGWQEDFDAFDDVGKAGLGDIAITHDESTMYVVDLGQKQLVSIPINSDGSADAAGVVRTDITSAALGAPCGDVDLRPFGLGILDDGTVVASATCTAESTTAAGGTVDPTTGPALGDPTQLSAALYSFSGGSFSNIVDVPIPTTSRGTQNSTTDLQGVAEWRPWVTEVPYTGNFINWPNGAATYPQPLVSDITQDGEDLVIGIMDIWGHQMGSNAFYESGGVIYQMNEPLSSGDILRAVWDGTAYSFPTAGPDYFYTGDSYSTSHSETALGSPVHIPGRPYSITNAFDPVDPQYTWQSGGLEWFANVDTANHGEGEHVRGYRLYDGGPGSPVEVGSFEKAAGIGDVQALCGYAPIEVGNRVWVDADEDGISDPAEVPVAGAVVELLDDAGNVIAATTTDVDGHYYFHSDDIAGFDRGGDYQIRLAQHNYDAGGVFAVGGAYEDTPFTTVNDAGSDDGNDSDAVDVNGLPTISFTATETDHTMDIGVVSGVYDLALIKTLAAGQADVIEPGDDVTFTIAVTNQGTIDATSFEVTDYLPAGFTLNDGAWTDNGATATYTGGLLAAGASTTIDITMTAGTVTGDLVNWAEISDDDGDDIDSTPDANQGNDDQPTGPGAAGDDVTNNAGGDEDDHDPALISVEFFDLALIKTLAAGQPSVIEPGDDVTFTITVTNQGTIDATSFEVTDYLPAGFTLNDGAWTDNGSTATFGAGLLAAGASTTIDITLTADSAANGDHVNWAEISSDSGLDIDSTPDANQGNDDQPTGPGATGDDVTNNAGGDEDDHDVAPISVELYDLALIKTLAAGQADVVEPGDDVTFTITVFNQGTIDATSFEVTDYMPAGFTLNDADWTAGAGNTATIDAGPLAAGASTTVDIIMTADAGISGDFENWAEISSDSGDDVDSTPDANQGNDDQPTGPGAAGDDVTNNAGGDEDDHDVAPISVEFFDLALIKTLAAGQASVIEPGDDVTFTITVTNQGTIDANSFRVVDYIPAGFSLNDPAWSLNGVGDAILNHGRLAASDSVDIDIMLTADANLAPGEFVNWAEISSDSGDDVDSTPDANQGNDDQPAAVGDPTDNVVDNTAGDEDDHDPASISVENFDLALIKTLAAGQPSVIEPGDDVTFTITVTNQGTIDATSFEVTDYLPAGFTLNDGAWTDNGSTATFDVGPLSAGASTTIDITLTADSAANGDHVNWAEISSDSGLDIDSTPDANQGNDDQPTGPGATGDDVTNNAGGDEDDHDPALVTIATFDLALTKVYTSDSFDDTTDAVIDTGADVTFTITVFNQGTIDATSFEVTDYMPAGFTLNDAAWADNGDGTATIAGGPLAAGASQDFAITMTAGVVAPGGYVNGAEISSDDGNDIDSTPDADPADDDQPSSPGDPTDDVIDNTSGDEDDHDIAGVGVENFDLALIKQLSDDGFGDPTDGLTENGADVTFAITVINQGTIDADMFEVTDYLPAGFVLNDAAWTDNGDGTATIAGGPLAAGDSVAIDITLTADGVAPGVAVNLAEISSDDGTDIDSTPDTDPADDAQPAAPGDPTDDVTNGTDGDEDDHDIAGVEIGIFDLALAKVYTSDSSADGAATDGRVQAGDDVTFTITVTNQGTLDADTFDVTDYLPAGLVLNDAAWTDNGDGTATFTGGPLAAGETVDITITTTVETAVAGQLVNGAEISSDTATDVDSTPDRDPADDNQPAVPGDPTDDVIDGTDGDEDDHDIAGLVVDVYDLALMKDFVSDTSADGNATDGVIQVGDDATFTITVTNEGTVDAAAFDITDYLPTGFVLNDAGWADNGNGTATTSGGPVAVGESVTVSITMTAVDPSAGSLRNWAEISADDGEDFDSVPNTSPNDDGAPPNQDDIDDAPLTVDAYDLALTKVFTSDTSVDGIADDGTIAIGDDITFTITVFNQGTVDAGNIEVTDFMPEGFTLNDAGWIDTGDGTAVTTIDVLAAGESVALTITMTAVDPELGTQLNAAEISADNGEDVDSTPNADVADDGPITDDEINNLAGDEDDHDPAPFYVIEEIVPQFDLALRKTLQSGASSTVAVGESVTWTITVYNQGTVDAANIEIIDYIPSGLVLADTDWTATTGGDATINIAGPIAPATSVSVDITTTVVDGSDLTNLAEISSADPVDDNGVIMVLANGITVPDVDSTPDATNLETPVDDAIDNASGDEDDHDLASVTLGLAETPTPVTRLAFTGTTWTTVFFSWAFGLLFLGAALVLFSRKPEEFVPAVEARRNDPRS